MRTIQRERERAVSLNLVHYRDLHNLGLYLLIIERDLTVLKHDALCSPDKWRQNLALRHIAMTVFEASDDLRHLLGKHLRATLQQFPVSENQWRKLDSITSDLAHFSRSNEQFLKDIRNYATAHRDHDAAVQLQFIEGIDTQMTLEACAGLYCVVKPLIALLIEVTEAAGNGRVMLSHFRMREASE